MLKYRYNNTSLSWYALSNGCQLLGIIPSVTSRCCYEPKVEVLRWRCICKTYQNLAKGIRLKRIFLQNNISSLNDHQLSQATSDARCFLKINLNFAPTIAILYHFSIVLYSLNLTTDFWRKPIEYHIKENYVIFRKRELLTSHLCFKKLNFCWQLPNEKLMIIDLTN